MRRTVLKVGALVALALLLICFFSCNKHETSSVTDATGGFEDNAGAGLGGNEHLAGGAGDDTGSSGVDNSEGSGGVIDNAGSGGDSGMGGAVGVDSGIDASDPKILESGVAENDSTAMDSGADARDSVIVDGNASETSGENIDAGTCCSDGQCLCRGPAPLELTSADGPYNTDNYNTPSGTIFYPIDAEPPFAAIAICDSFSGSGPQLTAWAQFFPTHGMVTIFAVTSAADFPASRAGRLLEAIEELRAENTNQSSPLFDKLSNRYGVFGYALGAGGANIASVDDPSLLTSIGMATWGTSEVEVEGSDVTVATLLFCGDDDEVAPCRMSEDIYGAIPESTPKMMMSIPAATHFSWFGPAPTGDGLSGQYALAFQKVFLEGDERWRPLLLTEPDGISDWRTNIP